MLSKQARRRKTGSTFPLSYVEAKRSRAEKDSTWLLESGVVLGQETGKMPDEFSEHARYTYRNTTLQLISEYN